MSENINNFKEATKRKLRFKSAQGFLTVEDLWDLPLTSTTGKANLDDVAKTIATVLKNSAQESFVETTPSKINEEAKLSLDLVKEVIASRKEENETKLNKAKIMQQLATIKAIRAEKQNEDLKGKGVEDLDKLILELSAQLK